MLSKLVAVRETRVTSNEQMEENESRIITHPDPPSKQYCSLVTFSSVMSSSAPPTVPLLTSRIKIKTCWKEARTDYQPGQNIYQVPRLTRFRQDHLVKVIAGDNKNVEEITTSDFIRASVDSPGYSIAIGEIKEIELMNAATAKLKVKQANEEEVLMICSVDNPFFVFCSGWASLFPDLTKIMFGLTCKMLSPGDNIMVAKNKQLTQTSRGSNFPVESTKTYIRRPIYRIEEKYKDPDEDDDEQPKDLSSTRHVSSKL